MKRAIGTNAFGVRTPIIKAGDDLVEIVADSIKKAQEYLGFEYKDRDIVGITESTLARSQGNYVRTVDISKDLNNKFSNGISVVFPILSRNRFSVIMRSIAETGRKIKVFFSYPDDEVGNSLASKYTLMEAGINVYSDTLNEEEFRKIAGDEIYHPFTGMDYLDLYKSFAVDNNVELYMSNNLDTIAQMSDGILVANIHEEDFLVEQFKKRGIKEVYSLKNIMAEPIENSGYNEEFGLYGSNLSSDDILKLFPRNSQEFVERLAKKLREETGKDIQVLVYGDGAFKDPVGHIWELADPVVSPGFTAGLDGLPNELKLKYIADNELKGISGEEAEKLMKEKISSKSKNLVGQKASLGTTPRQIPDLVGSLCDLMSGSGDKGTPCIYIQGYFDNYASE